MTQRAEVCLVGTLSSKNCCNYQKQLTAMGLWGHCSKDNNQKEAGSQAVPSNSALLKSGEGHLWTSLLRTIPGLPLQLPILGDADDRDDDI